MPRQNHLSFVGRHSWSKPLLRLSVLVSFWLTQVFTGQAESVFTEADRSHWSFTPRTQAAFPQPADPAHQQRVQTPVDLFILDGLEQAGLTLSEPAAERDLMRRITFGLTGLPPTPAALRRFEEDSEEQRIPALIDRLLASPRYGEHWGQHWLDVVRYAESEGFEYDREIHGIWRFRDYVVSAFNSDKPFDEFVIEQLAGDEFGSADPTPLTAAGFHRLGPVRRNAGNAAVAFSRNEILTERTNIIGAALLGVTIGCARCHDHMFDPIRQRDYYQMQAFFAATYAHQKPLAPAAQVTAHEAAAARIKQQITSLKKELDREISLQREQELRAQLKALSDELPAPLPSIATVREQATERTPIHLLDRGDPERPAEQVAPQFLGVLLPDNAEPFPIELQRPKTKLAEWIAAPQNPLTARVIANRVWHYHFGRGLVATANDFGVNGEYPSHPELLDYLANYLVEHDWSIKALHRVILLSASYQQSCRAAGQEEAAEIDPDVELLWRFRQRRLSAQEIRDAMLLVAGELNESMGGPGVMVPVAADLVNLLYAPAQWQVAADPHEHQRRSIYLAAKRNLRLPFMEVFDQPNLQISCPERESSTHAPQALELLNGEFSNQVARAFAERLRREAGSDPGQQVRQAFLIAVGRAPSSREYRMARDFLTANPLEELALAMFNLNAFIYVQ